MSNAERAAPSPVLVQRPRVYVRVVHVHVCVCAACVKGAPSRQAQSSKLREAIHCGYHMKSLSLTTIAARAL